MELLLNLLWLGLAIACGIALLKRVQNQQQAKSLWFIAAAVVCVVVLLFPVISMTDDLHSGLFTMEDSGKQRVTSVDVEHHVVAFITVRLLMLSASPSHRFWPSEITEPLVSTREGFARIHGSRPPPYFA